MKKAKAKIKKVIKGLNKASKLHAGQAKTLKGILKKKKIMKTIFLSLFFALLLLGSFYLGYAFALDIFEFICFRTDINV